MSRSLTATALSLLVLACASARSPVSAPDEDADIEEPGPDAAAPHPDQAAPPTGNDASTATSVPDAAGAAPDSAPPDPSSPGPHVDRSSPQAYALMFKASEADPATTRLLGNEQAFLDTRVTPRGTLVVHLHGSGEKVTCGYAEHGRLLAGLGFHVFTPCYDAAVSWSNSACGGDVGNCRLEMLDGMDHHPLPKIAPPESIEVRIAKALAHLTKVNPQGDWGYFLDGDKPAWSRIIISGQSFGATSAFLIAKHRPVVRAVALSGPLDGGAKWLKEPSMTPLEQMYSFSHVNDGQHPTHMSSLAAMGVPGMPVNVEMSMPPYANSHRLVGSMTTFMGARIDGHNATEARMQSPLDMASGKYLYEPVWRYMYGVP